ncbi:hypothetical protein [Kribbella ginsengisoli]|uniref:Lipoprotein n=1 Tax=Kribbella ginsengisoli TaxID=363865 RepID=A0ABP6WZL0_9ACTN
MPRRPLLLTVALCALPLAACNNSPEAGQPNTAPATSTTPTPTAPSTPTYTSEEQAAITAAKARYAVARAAAGAALAQPGKATRAALEKAGNGGEWVNAIADQIATEQENGWYQTGAAKIVSTAVKSVNLTSTQPEVRLTSCIDSTSLVTRYQSNGQPVPEGSSDGPRHKFQSRLVYAPDAGGKKMWFLVEEKVAGAC